MNNSPMLNKELAEESKKMDKKIAEALPEYQNEGRKLRAELK